MCPQNFWKDIENVLGKIKKPMPETLRTERFCALKTKNIWVQKEYKRRKETSKKNHMDACKHNFW